MRDDAEESVVAILLLGLVLLLIFSIGCGRSGSGSVVADDPAAPDSGGHEDVQASIIGTWERVRFIVNGSDRDTDDQILILRADSTGHTNYGGIDYDFDWSLVGNVLSFYNVLPDDPELASSATVTVTETELTRYQTFLSYTYLSIYERPD